MKHYILLFIPLYCAISAISVDELPIVLVHGINSNAKEMKPTEEYIKKYLPDRYVKSVNLGCCTTSSFFSMYTMIHYLVSEIVSDIKLQNGFIMIGHSQGGLIARYYLQHYNTPQVHTYISWGSPHMGIFGTPGNLDTRCSPLNIIESHAHILLYLPLLQKNFSVAGFWRDTLHYNQYLNKCSFLPYLNNEIMHPHAGQYKQNICALHTMVLVQSTNEYIIEPAQSCHFGYYTIGSKDENCIESLFESQLYKHDLLGLKTLHENGKLHLLWTDCLHENMQEYEPNFVENTLPFLTSKIVKL